MFQFKQFRIEQDRCGMKVGTDSILLGAWTQPGQASTILDLGSGTGILSLMLAQKSAKAFIDAVEIDREAYLQSKENISHSPWHQRIRVFNRSIQEHIPTKNYDWIVSNPPYFSRGLVADGQSRQWARQGHSLDLLQLVQALDRLLNNTGKCSLILPFSLLPSWNEALIDIPLYPEKICYVKSKPHKGVSRFLMKLGRKETEFKEDTLAVQAGEANQYTLEYQYLTRDYYL